MKKCCMNIIYCSLIIVRSICHFHNLIVLLNKILLARVAYLPTYKSSEVAVVRFDPPSSSETDLLRESKQLCYLDLLLCCIELNKICHAILVFVYMFKI